MTLMTLTALTNLTTPMASTNLTTSISLVVSDTLRITYLAISSAFTALALDI